MASALHLLTTLAFAEFSSVRLLPPEQYVVKKRRVNKPTLQKTELKKERLAQAAKAAGLMCRWCGTNDTPEWRIGPKQTKELCNACGLWYGKMLQAERKIPIANTTARIALKAILDDVTVLKQPSPPHVDETNKIN